MITCLLLLSFVAMEDEDKLPLEDAIVHRPAKVDEREALAALPAIALVAEKPQQPLIKLANQISRAGTKVSHAKPLYLLAAGPMLDGPDRVEARSLTRQDGKIVLQVHHTSARLSGTPLRRNIPWRPLVQVPVELASGKWEVVVVWIPYTDLPNGKPLGKPTTDTAQFEVNAAASP